MYQYLHWQLRVFACNTCAKRAAKFAPNQLPRVQFYQALARLWLTAPTDCEK